MSNQQKYPETLLTTTLLAISEYLENDINIYMIGGGAMIYYGRKAATKDLDLVFTEESSLNDFIKAAKKAGISQVNSLSKEYKNIGAWVILKACSGIQLDLFNKKVCNALSMKETVIKRAIHHRNYGRLHIYLMSPEDIVLFKGITERESDLEDIKILAESGINWNIVEEECLSQENAGKWANLLLSKLSDLRVKYGINPRLNKLRSYADDYVLKESFRFFLKDKELSFKELHNIIEEKTKYSPSWTRMKLKELENEGYITSRYEGNKKKYKLT
jgi:hypothetical protein